jgi:hypothetical protein
MGNPNTIVSSAAATTNLPAGSGGFPPLIWRKYSTNPPERTATAIRSLGYNTILTCNLCRSDWRATTRRFPRTRSIRSRTRSQHQLAAPDLDWYNSWLSRQLDALPQDLKEIVFLNGQTLRTSEDITTVFSNIEKYLKADDVVSLDEIATSILPDLAEKSSPESLRQLARRRQLVFALLGWQTMLYQPTFNICGPSELAIHKPTGQPDSGLVFDTYRVPIDLCDRPLCILLKCFGNLLPARSPDSIQVASETARAAVAWTPLYPEEMNANLLQTLMKVRFRWVDTLTLHLDYDKETGTLSLFAFPSVCVTALRNRGAIFAFASHERSPADPRADVEDVRCFLEEVLLSYRLLFGQHAKSRRLFQRIYSPAEWPFEQPDTLLSILCTAKCLGLEDGDSVFPEDHPVYFAARHFPVLYERIALLTKELDSRKPKSIRDLIMDRRDKLQWWTFWLISLLGGLSLILSTIQIILQGVQISMGSS